MGAGAPRGPDALGRLIGRRRAAVLPALDQPTSTTDLSHALEGWWAGRNDS